MVYLGLLLVTVLSMMGVVHAAANSEHFQSGWDLKRMPLITKSFLPLGHFLRGAQWWILAVLPVASVVYFVWCRKTYRCLLWTSFCWSFMLILLLVYVEIALSLLLAYAEKPVVG